MHNHSSLIHEIPAFLLDSTFSLFVQLFCLSLDPMWIFEWNGKHENNAYFVIASCAAVAAAPSEKVDHVDGDDDDTSFSTRRKTKKKIR